MKKYIQYIKEQSNAAFTEYEIKKLKFAGFEFENQYKCKMNARDMDIRFYKNGNNDFNLIVNDMIDGNELINKRFQSDIDEALKTIKDDLFKLMSNVIKSIFKNL